MDKSISSDLIRGHINTIILCSLYDGEKYGYEIIKEIEAKSEGQYELKQPTLYSSLTRLETQGYIESYWGGAVGGGRRKYFKLTESGRDIAKQNLSEWEYSRTVIDKLISDRDYDLTVPAPSPLDLNLLKAATTKIPYIKSQDETVESPPEPEKPAMLENAAGFEIKLVDDKILSNKKHQDERSNRVKLFALYERTIKNHSRDIRQNDSAADSFSKSISGESIAEANQDYGHEPDITVKNDNGLDLAICDAPVGKINFSDIMEMAQRDGINLKTCNSLFIKRKKTDAFNKGQLLFFSALLVFVTGVIELFLLKLLSGKTLNISYNLTLYCILLFACFPVGTLILYITGYGKDTVNVYGKNKSLSASLIVMLNAFLLICAIVLLLDINLSISGNILLYLVFPLFLLTNIPLSTVYYTLIKNKTHPL